MSEPWQVRIHQAMFGHRVFSISAATTRLAYRCAGCAWSFDGFIVAKEGSQ